MAVAEIYKFVVMKYKLFIRVETTEIYNYCSLHACDNYYSLYLVTGCHMYSIHGKLIDTEMHLKFTSTTL